jgi:hypothetical protein
MILDRTNYVGMGHTWLKMAQIRQAMIGMANVGEYFGTWMSHETGVPLRNAFLGGWMGIGKDALD